jgi:hypothetical protein
MSSIDKGKKQEETHKIITIFNANHKNGISLNHINSFD